MRWKVVITKLLWLVLSLGCSSIGIYEYLEAILLVQVNNELLVVLVCLLILSIISIRITYREFKIVLKRERNRKRKERSNG